MQIIEKFISPLIQQQFPAFYQEDGELFIAFVKAYYEWLETSTQELVLNNSDGFDVGDEVTQTDVKGKILFKDNKTIIVEILNFGSFRCNINCDTLDELVSSSGASTFIQSTERFNPIYWSRRLPEVRDIDRTIERFIVQFKNKYLPNVQFVTATNKELFIKNALDFYRAKGTERAVDLFFKLVYGFEARVRYPGDDIFKLSDNEWADIKYLEIDYADTNVNLIGNSVRGTRSGAEAFAERLVRIKKDTRYINVLYITGLKGDFQTGEQIRTVGLDEDVTAKVVGSLSEIEILSSSPGFTIGEDLIIQEGQGKGAKVRVTGTESFVGAVDFQLIDGGWGYSEDAEIIGSDRVLILNEYTNSNTNFYQLFDTFKRFQRVFQNLVSYQIDLESFPPTPLNVQAFDASNTLVLEGTAVSYDAADQRLVIQYDTESNAIFDAEEIRFEFDEEFLFANIDANSSYLFMTSANVIASGNTYTFTYELANGSPITESNRLKFGDILTQNFEYNNVDRTVAEVIVTDVSANAQTNEFFANVEKRFGVLRDDSAFPPIVRKSTNDEYRITKVSNTAIGIISETGSSPKATENIIYPGGNIYGVSPYWNDNIGDVEYQYNGTNAKVSGSFTGLAPKAIFEITERSDQFFIPHFSSNVSLTPQILNTVISDDEYGILPNPSLGFNDPISVVGDFSNKTVSSLSFIVTTLPGSGYSIDPFYVVYEKDSTAFEKYDVAIGYKESNKNFRVGERIELFDFDGTTSTPVSPPTKLRIYEHDRANKFIKARRLSLDDNLWISNNPKRKQLIRGELSGVTDEIVFVKELRKEPGMGLNAIIDSPTFSGDGIITDVSIVNSGFGYFDGEQMIFVSESDSSKTLSITGKLGKQGIGEGFSRNRKSFLSSDKYLADNDFYQEYSYQVLTALPFETYKQTLINVLHVAGTKPFGAYVATINNELEIESDSDTTQEIANT